MWRSNGGAAPTEPHLPASFPPGVTTVVGSLGTTTAPPSHTGAEPIPATPGPGPAGPRRLLPSTSDTGLHFALVTTGTGGSPEAARAELAAWAAATFTS